MSLNGKVALITGAAQGMGKGFAEALLKKGAKVCLVDVLDKLGEATAAEFQEKFGKDKVLFVKSDVMLPNDWKKTFQKLLDVFGHLDIMVNNAGIMDEGEPVRMVGVNLTGVILGTTLAVKVMRKDEGGNGGVIINVASRAGIKPHGFFIPAYTGTKFGAVGFTQTWARNPYLKQMGLRFACLCPAPTATALLNPMSVLYPMEFLKFITESINEISAVVAGFLELVEDEECNGAVMGITCKDGIQYFEKPLTSSKM